MNINTAVARNLARLNKVFVLFFISFLVILVCTARVRAEVPSINRFNFDIKINQYPHCLTEYGTKLEFITLFSLNPKHNLGLGCLDLQAFENISKSKSKDSSENKAARLLDKGVIPFSFEFSNRVSFKTLGGREPHFAFIYWEQYLSYTSIVEYLYRGNLAVANSIGMVFPITVTNPKDYPKAYNFSASVVNFNIILEIGLGFNYAFFGGDHSKPEESDKGITKDSNVAINPTFGILYNLSFRDAPNFEIESGIKIMPALRFDAFVRMQYDFYENADGTKVGITGLFDLWGLSGGLGLGVRY